VSRNRRHQSGKIWLVAALKAGILCALLGGSAVGYVMQKNVLHELGRGITQRETKLEHLKWENKMRAQHLANLQLPMTIEQRVRDQRLPLGKPQGPIVWLHEPTASELTPSNSSAVVMMNLSASAP
jgi:hypothetical protein